MFRNSLKRIFTVSVIFGTGYYAGKYTEQTISNEPAHAVNVLQNQPELTWKLKYFSAGKYGQGGRDGLWVTRFKPRYTGTAAYVVFHERETGKDYLLLTVQERIVNKQKIKVCEPPIGFFNGEYPSSIPHVVAEAAEREIEKQIQLGTRMVKYSEIYSHFMNEYSVGKLSNEPYKTDSNLLQTAYREIKEEAGLDILALQNENGVTISHEIIDERETPDVYSVIRKIHITGDKLPTIAKRNNDEIKHNEWVAFENINLSTKTVKTAEGEFPIKPRDRVYEDIQKILDGKKTTSPRPS